VAYAVTLAHAIRDGPSPEELHALALSLASACPDASGVKNALLVASKRPPDDYLSRAGFLSACRTPFTSYFMPRALRKA